MQPWQNPLLHTDKSMHIKKNDTRKKNSQLNMVINKNSSIYKVGYNAGRQFFAACALVSMLCVAGCNSSNVPKDEQGVVIKDDEIILPTDAIWSTKPERYQPSFNLYGVLVPIAQATIVAPASGEISSVLVQEGDWVKKQQTLLNLSVTPLALPTPTATYTQTTQTDDAADKTSTKTQKITITGYDNRIPTPIGKASINNVDILDSNETLTDDISNATQSLEENLEKELDTLAEDVDVLTNEDTSAQQAKPKPTDAKQESKNFIIKAPFAGKVSELISETSVNEQQVLMKISDSTQLQLIGELPISTQSQLSIGQNVNFTIPSTHDTFTGQISKITPDTERQILTVHAPVTPSRISKAHLQTGMSATMSIEYGQIQVGVRLPATAIHNVDLSVLTAKHPRPAAPLEGEVWVIKQDQHLELQPVQIVAYFADTQQYLVSGINNDSLICVAELPFDSEGKKVSVH